MGRRIFLGAILPFFILLTNHLTPSCSLEYTPSSEKSKHTSEATNKTTIPQLEGIDFAYEPYKSWGQSIEVSNLLLVAYPRSSDQVVAIVNWARKNGRKVRPRGYKHTYAPLTVTKDTDATKVVLVDLTKHLTKLEMVTIPPEQTVSNEPLNAVSVETGTAWQDFMAFCESNNVGIAHSIIIGDASVGGVLAIGAHGAGIQAEGESIRQGFSFGSLSNLIANFDAVVWDPQNKAYVLKSFLRSDPDASAFLAHVGRAFLTRVTLIVGENYNLRCQSIVDLPADELFANPLTSPNVSRTFTMFLDETGRADVQWYQFTKNPWLKVWRVEKEKPSPCVEVVGPYNFQFPTTVNDPSRTVPELGEIAYNNVVKGLTLTNSSDIWGPSKNILLYSNGSSQPITYGGFVILTSRQKIQTVLSMVTDFYRKLNEEYSQKSKYPIDYYIKFRVTGLDDPKDTLLRGAKSAALSPLSVPEDYPQFNIALWMNTFTHKDNPLGSQFMTRFESFYHDTFNGLTGLARPEWSKSWAYTDDGPFLNQTIISEIIPARFGNNWKWAISVFNKYDPERLYTNEFLDKLFLE